MYCGPWHHFYRAMHFSAKRGIAIACRLSVRLSVCLSVTLVVREVAILHDTITRILYGQLLNYYY